MAAQQNRLNASHLSLFFLFLGLVIYPFASAFSFETGASTFSIQWGTRTVSQSVGALFVMPEKTATFEATSASGLPAFHAESSSGGLTKVSPAQWKWSAPSKPGLYPIVVKRADTGEKVTLNVFVKVPYGLMRGEKMNGYAIGRYPEGRTGAYERPEGFIEVTRENEDTLVSPHFRLKLFLCKQKSGYPKYLLLQERLLTKLEAILAKVNELGHEVDVLHVMSGFRTPAYNRSLGNVKFSRHLFGDAADVYIEEPKKNPARSASTATLYAVIDRWQKESPGSLPVGGLGKYGKTKTHPPFIHVDARGYLAKWEGGHAVPLIGQNKSRRLAVNLGG